MVGPGRGTRLRSVETMSDTKKPRTQKKKDSKIETRPAFRKAKSLYRLHKPDSATEGAWKLYITNRSKASRLHDLITGPDDYSDDENDFDEDDKKEFKLNREFFYNIDRAMALLEKNMGLQKHLLATSYSVIKCDVAYADMVAKDEELRECAGPELVNIITRIYSPTRPLYIDVHFAYQWDMDEEGLGFKYRIGFKVYSSPAKNDYPSDISKQLSSGAEPDAAYISNGWRPFAYGHNLPQVRGSKILNVLALDSADVRNICDALWGPQVALLEDADQKTKNERRRLLINSVRVLVAGAGIVCEIACLDKEQDSFTSWELGRIHKWIAHEVRNVCGFQLKRDLGEVSQSAEVPPWPDTEPWLDDEHNFDDSYDKYYDYEFTHRPFPY